MSGSPGYNDKLRSIDRKILAIETESGGLFSVARQHDVPAITIRGISDYAGVDKNDFERATGNNARKFAITTATSFLARQLRSPEVIRYLDQLNVQRANDESQLPLSHVDPPQDTAAGVLIGQSEEFNEKLRDLSPGFALVASGYRLPVPRLRILDTRSGSPNSRRSEPIEVREALRDARVITLHVPREYPDLSLSWIIARDLLSAQLVESQLVPSVVEARSLQKPRAGIAQLVDPKALRLAESPSFTSVFIIDDFNFGSRSRCEFLRQQIDEWPNAKFVIVTRNPEDVYLQADFTKNVASSMARLCDVSFTEISVFIQKNFRMDPSAAEVVAVRLRETFHRYALPAHPSYFADIPSSIFNALLQANRRAELIELAVTGYLSFVVAEDQEPIALSRKTRESFLSELAFSMKVEGRTYTEAQLTEYAEAVANKFDYSISPARFVATFIERHILHIENGLVQFTLPFMEAFLLARRLVEEAQQAMRYFVISSTNFDYRTFALHAGLGPSAAIVDALQEKLDAAIQRMSTEPDQGLILLDQSITVALLDHQDRIQSVQQQIQKAEDDVRNDRDQSKEKQKLLDASDRVREDLVARASATKSRGDSVEIRLPGVPKEVESTWAVAVSLLGSGAERLEANVKRRLVQKVVKLTGLIIDRWTRANLETAFSEIKRDLMGKEELIATISKSDSAQHTEEARRLLATLIDLVAYVHVLQPFTGAMTYLCEEARNIVLAESIANSPVEKGGIDELLQDIWLADINVPRGKARLINTIKQTPKSRFLRHIISIHIMARVFWNHWRKEDRLSLLNIADASLKGIGLRKKTGALQRLIENLPESDELDV